MSAERRSPTRTTRRLWFGLTVVLCATGAMGAVLLGDLNGDGAIDSDDETLLKGYYGAEQGDSSFEPAADLNHDGRINVLDLALFGAGFGATGGEQDGDAPGLLITLNDIPDDMNDLLVAPPDRFQITLHFDRGDGSAIDTTSLSVSSSQDIGAYSAGSELAALFSVTPTRALWEIPAGSDLARTSHYLSVSVDDAAGNRATEEYGFAVRNFAFGPPLENLQTIFLDFEQDRSLGPEIDILEDLREFGLSSAYEPGLEAQMLDWVIAEITGRANQFYGRNFDGTPGDDAADVLFVSSAPTGPHSRICVGGQSALGAAYAGASIMDLNNSDETSDDCANPNYGVFPNALDNLWGGSTEYQAVFYPLDPGGGGIPVGESPLDAIVLAPDFDPESASAEETLRWYQITDAVAAFAQAVGSVTAHETGHLLGLTAHGPTPGGLFGGEVGGETDHNVTPQGGTPAENFLMNRGGSFSFEEITGRNGEALPSFRPLSWAYLRDRIVVNSQVTGLYPPPKISSAGPNPLELDPPVSAQITITGDDFVETPWIDLVSEGLPTPRRLQNVIFIDPQTLQATANAYVVPPGTYDVRVTNPDGQKVSLVDGLEVQ